MEVIGLDSNRRGQERNAFSRRRFTKFIDGDRLAHSGKTVQFSFAGRGGFGKQS